MLWILLLWVLPLWVLLLKIKMLNTAEKCCTTTISKTEFVSAHTVHNINIPDKWLMIIDTVFS